MKFSPTHPPASGVSRPLATPATAALGECRPPGSAQGLAVARPQPDGGRLAVHRRCSGFTLAEVLAALVFMAIVIPVAVEGLRLASRAGQVAQRKAVALRLAEQVLNEQILTGEWLQNSQGGTLRDGPMSYRWRIQAEPWNNGLLRLLTVSITFAVQGAEQDLQLSTLVDTPTQTNTTTTSTSTGTQTK